MFPDIGLIKIHSVYLPTALHPVLDEDELSPLFTSGNVPLWLADDSHEGGRANPCTIDLANCKDQTVFVAIQWPGSTVEFPVRLKGQLESGDQFSQNDSFVMPATQGIVAVPTKLIAAWSTVVPWGINSTITWTLESVSTEGEVETKCPFRTHPIQIYAVSARLPPFLSYVGIPQEVLDFFLLTTRKSGLTTFPEYVTHVVQRVHNDAGSRYERSGGGHNFADITTSSGTSELNISKWVVDLRANRTSPASHPYYTVNCYDQGAIVQLGLILGIQTLEEETKVRWHFLYPFGYIKTLKLVGWGNCNNPFLPGSTEVEGDAEVRSNFRNHVFLSYDWKVLDATAGPAIGTLSIEEYLETSIDRDAKLYSGEYIKGDDAKHEAQRKALRERYPEQSCPTGGLPSDVINGHGLNTLSTGPSKNDLLPWAVKEFLTSNGLPHSGQVEGSSRPAQDGYTYAFGDLNKALEDIKIDSNTTLHFGEPTYSSGPTDAQWTWSTKPGSPRVDLFIALSATPKSAMIASETYLSGLSNSLHNALVVDNTKVVESSLHLVGAPDSGMGFHLWVAGNLLVVLKGLATNDELLPIIKKIKEHKVKSKPHFETVVLEDRYCNLNAITEVEIQIEDALDHSVRYTTGNVLIVKAVYKEGKYCFDFIGRQYGLDIVTLTIGKKTGDHKTYNVPFAIRDDTGSVVPKPDPALSMTSPKYSVTDIAGDIFKGSAFSSRVDIEDGLKDNIAAMHVNVTNEGIHSVKPIYSSKGPAAPEADDELFVLEAGDFITIMTGVVTEDNVLIWIQFYTNKGHKSVVFGNKGQGKPFSWSGPKLMALSGRGDVVVNTLRAYWLDPDSTSPSTPEIAKVANSHSKVVGGVHGNMLSSDARLVVDLADQPLTAVHAQYGDVFGKTLGGFGTGGGDQKASFELKTPDEWIVRITGRAGRYINTIQFHTNKGGSSSEYGDEPGGESFERIGDRLVYLSGRGYNSYGVIALQAHWLNANPEGGRDEFVE